MTDNTTIREAEQATIEACHQRQTETALAVLRALDDTARRSGNQDLVADLGLSIAALEQRGG